MIARHWVLAGLVASALAALALAASMRAGEAQGYPPPGYPPSGYPQSGYPASPAPGGNPVCMRLQGQLAAIERGYGDPARDEQIRRYEDAANRQQFELDRVVAQSRRMGCEGIGFLSLFGGQSQQCGPLNTQIQQMRANLDQIHTALQRLKGNTDDREGQRRALLIALGQNNCGPQYNAAVQPERRSLFDALFGPGTVLSNNGPMQSSTFRTLCVRTCDGYYFPISYSTVPGHFAEDERACQRMCPAAEVSLYTYRNPGEDVTQAVSLNGAPYSQMPNAFRYRKEVNPSCSCRAPGQSWADALKQFDDQTVERGDIIVNEERAKQLSLPRDAKGRPITASGKPNSPTAGDTRSSATADAAADSDPSKRTVRSVGPTFVPTR